MNFALIKISDYCFDMITSDNLRYPEAGIELRMFFMNHMKEIMDGTIDPKNSLMFVPTEDETKNMEELYGKYRRFNPRPVEGIYGDYSTKIEGTEISNAGNRTDFKYGSKFVPAYFSPQPISDYEKEIEDARAKGTLLSYTEDGTFHIIDQLGMQFQMISRSEYLKKDNVSEGTLRKKLNERAVEAIIYDKHYTTINSFFPPETMLKYRKK